MIVDYISWTLDFGRKNKGLRFCIRDGSGVEKTVGKTAQDVESLDSKGKPQQVVTQCR
jgi:hypothetical protein